MDTLRFVIVGHVDHGKSTLIGRLLFETDSLPPDRMEEIRKAAGVGQVEFAHLLDHLDEERRQGITIDTTRAVIRGPNRHYEVIDAPGHVEFVKNMITGASQAEAALLIIDAERGVEEQTRRHAYILSLLQLSQVVVVLNKMDLVGYDEAVYTKVRSDAEQMLAALGITPSVVIPVCAREGENVVEGSARMSWYQGPTVLEGLQSLQTPQADDARPLFFPVQDVYKIDDRRIHVGKIESGTLSQGEEVTALTSGQKTRVRAIEKLFADVTRGYAQEAIGITTEDPLFLERGEVLAGNGAEAEVTDRFRARLFWMSKEELKTGERWDLQCATQEVPCRIEAIERRIDSSSLEVLEENAAGLKNLEVGEVIVKTKKPIVVKKFQEVEGLGRFVLLKNEDVCAGGIVV